MSKDPQRRTAYRRHMGSYLMGGGGGGAMVGGTDLLAKYKQLHPEKPVQLTLLETADMAPGAYAAVTAGMALRPCSRMWISPSTP